MHFRIREITDKINERSLSLREKYLSQLTEARVQGPHRKVLHCGNLAHGFAACLSHEKQVLREMRQPNIGIISAYNDMLSAHQPYEHYPSLIKKAIAEAGGIAQFAGGVPAMCDGITQGQPGMELSLLSRDVIAMSAAIGLSHNMFDGGLMLGICDKIVPGLLISALSFGHLPFMLIPAGPMPSGISNKEKARIRQLYAEKKVDKDKLLDAEAASYHSPGTCTFYGTANSNQLLVEIMGLQLPGSSFVNPNTALRDELTKAAAQRIIELTDLRGEYLPVGKIVDAKSLVNAIIGLLATGGSTNHTMHLIAIARAAGLIVNWDDFAELSKITPLLARVYPNGEADINQFQQAGGMAYLIKTLLENELLHADVHTVAGFGLQRYTQKPILDNGQLSWIENESQSADINVLRPVSDAFQPQGGLQVLSGNLGRAVFKTSAVAQENQVIEAPAVVFSSQEAFEMAFHAGELERNCVIVVRFQGPKACGMPELHKLTPPLGVLQDRGFRVALLTDGRMSGASGKVPAAIHVTPEAVDQGLISKIVNGDMILIDGQRGIVELLVSAQELKNRQHAGRTPEPVKGMGRELFVHLRNNFSSAEEGACSLFAEGVAVNGE
ncbi:phosphogluconate dehydratase [Legionella quinlivanii]|uniref:Phosphogluconate dehydratase n=1 Tax=Legionella quinlivanii TaxID=45073 RepID=A0A0W0Y091_9GAMM|nr:phosphogluconate dehydratase [Legionella quinlivanii]KTD49955.1 phosphogluconate dehydratase [Legionella quinlivanii]SEF96688.1 6-phosphogluconate dehydratase [Legionella quinlivanii DSM 21216]STY11269.1 phosphogluconate dehydratase [Legionella quinlivanii]